MNLYFRRALAFLGCGHNPGKRDEKIVTPLQHGEGNKVLNMELF